MKFGKIGKPMTRILALVTALALILPCGSAGAVTEGSKDDYEELVSQYATAADSIGYTEYLAQHEEVRPNVTVEVDAADFVRYEEYDAAASPEIFSDFDGMSGDSVLTSENSLIEFEVTVEKPGFYDLSLVYYPVAGKNSAIQRSIFLDGILPYEELSLVEFQRVWKMDTGEANANEDGVDVISWIKDNQGNDLKPSSVEIPEWIESYVYDSEGYITTELSLYLSAGSHTITLTGLREPMLLHALVLSNRTNAEGYEAVKQKLDASGAQNT